MHAIRSVWIVLAAIARLNAQSSTVVVPDAVSCARCTINLKRVVTIGDADGKGTLSTQPNGVAVDGRGRIWVTQEGEMPMVFDASGKFLQSVGRRGSGPGEFQYPWAPVPIVGDSVLIHDRPNIVVVGPDLLAARSIRAANEMGSTVVGRWPSVVFSWRSAWGRDVLLPAVLRVAFSADEAKVTNAFGPADRGDLRPQEPLYQRLGSASTTSVWSFDTGRRYRLSQWGSDGALMRSFERKPEWLVNPSDGSASTLARPYVAHVAEDVAGLLWVCVNVARPGFRDALPNMQGRGEIAARAIPFERLHRTTVEIIDPRSARVVARRTLDEYIVAVLPNGRAAAYSVDDAGIPHLTIIEISLVGR